MVANGPAPLLQRSGVAADRTIWNAALLFQYIFSARVADSAALGAADGAAVPADFRPAEIPGDRISGRFYPVGDCFLFRYAPGCGGCGINSGAILHTGILSIYAAWPFYPAAGAGGTCCLPHVFPCGPVSADRVSCLGRGKGTQLLFLPPRDRAVSGDCSRGGAGPARVCAGFADRLLGCHAALRQSG